MRWRPILISAACSFVAALALVVGEGAVSNAHFHHPGGGGNAAAPKTEAGGSGMFDTGQSASGAFGSDEASGAGDPNAPSSGGGSQPGLGLIDPSALAQSVLGGAGAIVTGR